MSDIDDLRARVSALEYRVDAEATARLSMDNDLHDINQTLSATHHLVQALAITQSQHTQALRAIREEHGARLSEIVTLLNRLIGPV